MKRLMVLIITLVSLLVVLYPSPVTYASPETDETRLEGKVFNSIDGKPLPNAKVEVFLADLNCLHSATIPYHEQKTDQNGYWSSYASINSFVQIRVVVDLRFEQKQCLKIYRRLTKIEVPILIRDKVNKIPNDTLSESELERLNIFITSTDKDVSLLIRKSALELDPLIKYAGEVSRRYQNDPAHPVFRLHIILSNTVDLLSSYTPIPSEYREIYDELSNQLKAGRYKSIAGIYYSYLWNWSSDYEYDIRGKKLYRVVERADVKHYEHYIFIAIGGYLKPTLEQSFPSHLYLSDLDPFVVTDKKYWIGQGADYIGLRMIPGFILRHETRHFVSRDELDVDIDTYRSLDNAFVKWVNTGDSSWYYFIFITREGAIYN